MTRIRVLAALATASLLLACPKKDGGGGPQPSQVNCEADLAALGVTTSEGTGASALTISDPSQLIGGQSAVGDVGDTLIQNDRIRVIVQRPSRNIGAQPYGGNIIDADLQRPDGVGKDQFGKVGILYSFGRTTVAREVKVLKDGSEGGSVVVAVNAEDTVNDFINVQNMIVRLIGGSSRFVINPEQPVPAKLTTYYVLNPGEQRVRVLTAFCNDTDDKINAPAGDLVDRGGTVDLFNPGMCQGTMGNADSCFVDPSPWFGYQGEGVAYGMRSWKTDDLSKPENENALLTVSGVSVTLTGGKDQTSLLQWLDASATRRNGNFIVPAHDKKYLLRDFIVGRDLGEVATVAWANAGVPTASIEATVQYADGTAAPGARVAVIDGAGKMATLLVADESGVVRTTLPAAGYTLQAGLYGYALGTPVELTLTAGNTAKPSLKLGETRKLTVSVKDPFNAPLPAKVTVICPSGTCPVTTTQMRKFHELEVLPDNVAAIVFVPPQGSTDLQLAPGNYEVVVTRGPEWSAWPSTWPVSGQAVDLSSNDQSVSAVIAHVVDTTGWMSADLHVHSVNSADASLKNEARVINFAAEGVDALCSTDHDFITDFAPFVRSTQSENVIASMVGLEVTPFDWGHYNTYPVVATPNVPNGGAFDWAGGEGPTLRQSQMIDGVRANWPDAVVQMNHPRGALGSLTLMKVDTPTLATHSPPEDFRQEPSPEATADNTALFTTKFDALEIMNGSSVDKAHRVMNDWFTFLSRGWVRTGTATSDTHYALKTQGGYPRTFVDMGGKDLPTEFDPKLFAQGVKAHHAFGTNGPFMKVTARKLPSGTPVAMGDTLSISPGDQVEITVDVQTPEWMFFDTLELYTHAPGREAYNGLDNNDWPVDRISQSHNPPVGVTPLEPVVVNGQTFRRRHIVDTFTVTPTADTWYVVVLSEASARQTLFPLHFDGVTCSGGKCTANDAMPLAFSNPILIDADGSGSYDHPPMPAPPPVPRFYRPEPPPLTGDALLNALRKLAHEH